MFDSAEMYGLFARLVGLVFAFQFATTAHQLLPLIGRRGVEPVAHLISAFRRDHGLVMGVFKLPTLFWCSTSDAMLRILPWVGTSLGLSIFSGALGDYNSVAFLGCWVIWLSILNSDSNVFGIPWDNLLLECGFWAIFLPAPGHYAELSLIESPHTLVHFGFVLMSFRVMFGMGFAKFKSRDERTRTGSFIFHFLEWQPMATVGAFYLRALPMPCHKLLLLGLFIAEMVTPWFVFVGPEGRLVFALTTLGLQVGIYACGNYGIFNVMLVVLSLPLLADTPLFVVPDLAVASLLYGCLIVGSLPYVFLLDSWSQGLWTYVPTKVDARWPFLSGVMGLYRVLAPFRLWASYGIFVPRGNYPKLVPVIQMSDDGETWLDVVPHYMTCNTNQKPKHFAPYHPRLDHFIYYNHIRKSDYKVSCLTGINPYYVHQIGLVEKIVEHLYQGNPVAASLFAKVPINKPKCIRLSMYSYQMNSLKEIGESGEYWQRELMGSSSTIERISLNDNTGIHPVYSPFVFDTLKRREDGVAVYSIDGQSVPIQRNAMVVIEQANEPEGIASYKRPLEYAEP